MPGGDRTGPMGMGSMTGRAAGFCAGYDAPGYANALPGRGFGRGFRGRGWRGGGRGWGGGGRGWRHMYYATGLPGWMRFGYSPGWAAWQAGPWDYGATAPGPMPRDQEMQMLKDHAEALKAELDQISARIEELEKET